MIAFLSSLTALTALLWKASLQASLVIALVLLVRWLGRKHFSPRVRYALWLLVVLRLVLPTSLESSISVFQQARTARTIIVRAANPASAASGEPAMAKPIPTAATLSRKTGGDLRSPAGGAVAPTPPPRGGISRPVQVAARGRFHVLPWTWPVIFSGVWLAGVAFLLARIIVIPRRLNARVARLETAPSPAVFEILEQAKRLIAVNQVLPIVQSRAVESPALLGFIRPWLLLPHGLVERFTPDELRLVFLHELAHLKRRDIAMNWLTTLLQVLHWFNPLVWYAFARMRADREEACDELALAHARAEENRTYGHAIVKLLEGFARPPVLPGLVGILEDKQHMQRRITMIAQFKRMLPWSAPAAGLFLVLGIVTLTDAQTEKTSSAKIFGPSNGPSVRVLLSGTTAEVYGVLSPDETAVAYMNWVGWEGSEGGDLVVRDLRTGESKTVAAWPRVKNHMQYPDTPVWSADSRSIAYNWRDTHGSDSVRIVSREGGEQRVICKQARFWMYDWSKDGKQLLGSLYGERLSEQKPEANAFAGRLALLDVDRDAFQVIGPGVDHARLSPDGRFVVYEQTVGGKRHAFLMGADGSHVTPLSSGAWEDTTPAFSADGRQVFFSSDRRGGWDLWAIPIDQGNVAGELFPIRYDFGDHPKWITSSGKLAFRLGAGGSDIYEVSATQSPGSAGTQPRRISRAAFGRNIRPAWSRDGSMLAYTRPGTKGRHPALCIQADGTEQLYDPAMISIRQLFWSPDGQTIAMHGWDETDQYGIDFFSLANHARTSERLEDDGNHVGTRYWLGFSADGKEFHYFEPYEGKRFAVTIATNATREIPSPEEFSKARSTLRTGKAARPESWDGSSVVYVSQRTDSEQELIVADSDWKNPRVVAHVIAPGVITRARLSPDRTKIAFGVTFWPKSPAINQLHVQAIDGSWERIVDTANKSPRDFGWSADGRSLAVELDEQLPSEIGVLENFLPTEKLAAK